MGDSAFSKLQTPTKRAPSPAYSALRTTAQGRQQNSHTGQKSHTDIRELIEVDDVMEDDSLRFGPNGGLVFCMEYFANNFDWLENCLGHVEDDYILFDCPGQIELYTHLPVMKQLVQQLEQWEFRVCGVFLVDSQFMVESFKFISGILAALSAMVSLEIPQVNIMTKMDLLSKKAKKEIEKFLDPDMYSLLEDSTSDLRSKKFKKLTKAICGLIDDYSMVRFLPYDQSDEESMNIVLQHIDFAIQYGEDLEFKEPKNARCSGAPFKFARPQQPETEQEGRKLLVFPLARPFRLASAYSTRAARPEAHRWS
ncbi:GPN-loop GTPase 3 [Saguinus oedipus]|uniref:GPN-loop GTPase 3 n=1 Tax=Saguinus oedipus TaxID=9490 RepID=A0ABQ9V0N2_SAGOE|nr:GPN-loop GTPase 3 [Saguinus oedipus]